MTNDQNLAARKAFNTYRATIGMRSTQTGASETITLYRLADPETASPPFTVAREASAAEVSRLFTAAIRSIL